MKQSTAAFAAPVSFTGLGEVKVTDGYCARAMEKEVAYLLKLDVRKLLYYFYVNAGLAPDEPSSYQGGWEGALIGGHTLGHYMVALAQAYANANTSEPSRAELKARITYLAAELKRCQDNAVTAGAKAGFLWGAAPAPADRDNKEAQFDFVERGRADIAAEAWVPWYTMHKIVAGLVALAVYAGDGTAKEVAAALGDWVCDRVNGWSEETRRTVLAIEYGGMNDCMYELYLLTGKDRYAVAAHRFDEEDLFTKARNETADYLDGVHANTTIPKILGALNRYIACHGKTVAGETVDARSYLETAEKFWDFVVRRHTYVTGGNSEWEHFGKDSVLDRERTNANCETCNTYNMLKLSRALFGITGERKYLDYYENTFYNAILSSQNPETGMTTYFQPMATGYFKVYSSEENNFWCCTGSGMESFSKLGDSIFYDAGNATYLALYLSARYETDKVALVQEADLERSDTATVTVERGKTTLRFRRPYWSDGFTVRVNGEEAETAGDELFVSVDVEQGDRVVVQLKKRVRAYDLPDGKNTYAFMYGPFLLSADLGAEDMKTTTTGVNVTVPAEAVGDIVYAVPADSVAEYMRGIDGHLKREQGGKFTLKCENGTLTYSLHYRKFAERYGIYMKFKAGKAK